MTSWGGNSYAYDTGNSMVKQNGRWFFLYNFSGERVASIDWQGSIATREVDWTIRGPDNQVLSSFKLVGEDQAGNWSREIDYIWMGRRLLGTEDGSGVKKHYHTDHLGSIRLVTNAAGNKVSEHEYLPYGQELTAPGDGVMKFTGHERDGETGMDYMHARFYSSFLGRFNSVDPILGGGGVLNRYSYVGGRPMNYVDPREMKKKNKAIKTCKDTAADPIQCDPVPQDIRCNAAGVCSQWNGQNWQELPTVEVMGSSLGPAADGTLQSAGSWFTGVSVREIVVVTVIRPPHEQAGVKSTQTVVVDTVTGDIMSESVETGTTEFGVEVSARSLGTEGFHAGAVANAFGRNTFVMLSGETGSWFYPFANINYSFGVSFDRASGSFWFLGSHDGFPSYEVWIDGVSVYDYSQGWLGELSGCCDVTVGW